MLLCTGVTMRRLEMLDPRALDGRRILRAAEFHDLAQAEDILSETRIWAENRRANIEEELHAQRREAFTLAYSEGFSAFSTAVEGYQSAADAVKERVMDLLRTCLRRVLGSLPADDVLYALVAPVLTDIRINQEISVLAHPDAIPDLQMALERVSANLPSGVTLIARADPKLDAQDCLIYTEDEVFNVSIPVTCDLLCRALAGTFDNGESDAR
jgi:flagellar biosynthesis/type III secretory pathway protein FliH